MDPEYDFVNDQPSVVARTERPHAHIWDVYDRETVPIDGVVLSRQRLRSETSQSAPPEESTHPVEIPGWLNLMCDSGAWGYKQLPFPPYSPTAILDVYERAGASVGVTVDHLIAGTGHRERIYLAAQSLSDEFSRSDLHPTVRDRVDVVVNEWPSEWPDYVEQHEPSICGEKSVTDLPSVILEQPYSMLIPELEQHPSAVYRADDRQFRYDLTRSNLKAALEAYSTGTYSFRLMAALQGWDSRSYVEMVAEALDFGYDYLGLGGLAGGTVLELEQILREVSQRIATAEREQTTRIDTHLFGVVQRDRFEMIGRNGISSCDSTTPLRAAWCGGHNYHHPSEEKYDALRVRYPPADGGLKNAIALQLRGHELLAALRAFDSGRPIDEAIEDWYDRATSALSELERYLRGHKHDARYQHDRLRKVRANFRAHYHHAGALNGSVGDRFVTSLVKLLREDTATDPLDFRAYEYLLETAESILTTTVPTELSGTDGSKQGFEAVWQAVKRYAQHVGDEDLLSGYRRLLERRPWEDCDCRVCDELGIEVAVFRGSDRNKRRGYHNIAQLYQELRDVLPRIAVLVQGSATLPQYSSVERYLREKHPAVWEAVNDVPVIDIGVLTARGVHEWWEPTPPRVSLDPDQIQTQLSTLADRYQDLYIDASSGDLEERCRAIQEPNCRFRFARSPRVLRSALSDRLEFETEAMQIRGSLQS